MVFFWDFQSFQKSIYRFHVPAHILKQAVVRTSEVNSEEDVSTDVAQPLDYSFFHVLRLLRDNRCKYSLVNLFGFVD